MTFEDELYQLLDLIYETRVRDLIENDVPEADARRRAAIERRNLCGRLLETFGRV